MYKKSKRFLAGFLAFLLVVTMVPSDMLSVVYAEEDEAVTADAPESAEQNDEADEVLDDAKADEADEVLDDAKADEADEVLDDAKAGEADEVLENVKTGDVDTDEAFEDDNEALTDSDAIVDSDEMEKEEILDAKDTDSDSEDSEYDLENKAEIEDEELIYSQSEWTSGENSTLLRTTTWDFTGPRTKATDIAGEDTLKGLKCLAGSKITFKNWSTATDTKPSAKQGLSITANSAAGIPLDKDTNSVKVTITLNSSNDNRVATIGESSVRVWQKNSGASKNKGSDDGDVAAQTSDDKYFDTTYTETYTSNDMTTVGDNKYIKFLAMLGEWKIDKIEITETKSAGPTLPKATFTTEGTPALVTSNTGNALHPGDKLTLSYDVTLIEEGLEDGQTDADESVIKWERVNGDTTTEINADANNKKEYTITADDIGSTIKVTVTPKTTYSSAGDAATATSAEVTELEDGFKVEPYFETTGNEEEPLVTDELTVKYELGKDETRKNAEIKWYRIDPENDEDNPEEISVDGDGTTYTLSEADEGKIVRATVSLTDDEDESKEALTGSCETAVISAWRFGFNESPALTSDSDDDTVLYPGDTLTLSYELNVEGTDESEIKWESVKDGNATEINTDAEDSTTYVVTKDDIGSTIKVTVTPKATVDGEEKTGDSESDETIIVSEKFVTFITDPSFEISTGGNLAYPQPGDKLTVVYTLDKADDDTDESTIAWTRVKADGTEEALTADTDDNKSYTIVEGDIGSTIKASVTPKTDSDYTSEGNAKDTVSYEVKEQGYVPSTAYNMSLKGSDIPSGTFTSTFVKNGFTINAGDDTDADTKKSVAVDANSKTINNTAYTARLKMSGPGAADYRSVSFTTVKEATLAIACMSSNDTTPAKLAIAVADNGTLTEYTGSYTLSFYNKDGNSIVKTVSEAYSAGGITINNKLDGASDAGGSYITVTLPAGTYYLYTPDTTASAVNFYEIKVTYDGGADHTDSEYATVTFNKNGGINDIASQKVLKGEKCLKPDGPVKDGGYKFKGWYTDADGTTAYDFNTVITDDLTLYAGWETDPDYKNLVLDMKDLPQGDYTTEFTYHGFTFKGASGKALSVASSSATVDGTDYTQVLKFGGTGASDSRYIKFTTTEKSTVTVVAIKGGTSDTRKLALNKDSVNASSATYSEEMTSTTVAQKWVTEDVPAGTWYVYSMKSGINIYYISVVSESGEGTYGITVTTAVDNAAVTAGTKTTAQENETVKLSEVATVTPVIGYKLSGWTVKAGDDTVTVTNDPTDGYVFTMPAAAVTVTPVIEPDESNPGETTVEKPVVTSPAGTQFGPEGGIVELSCDTDGATIYYTTDGTNPTTASTEYTAEGIEVKSSLTIKAIAVKDGKESAILEVSYTVLSADDVFMPIADPTEGEVSPNTEITLSCATADAVIYYTTDGSAPTKDSTEYTAPIKITEAVTIKAIAIKGEKSSEIATFTYTIRDYDDNEPEVKKISLTDCAVSVPSYLENKKITKPVTYVTYYDKETGKSVKFTEGLDYAVSTPVATADGGYEVTFSGLERTEFGRSVDKYSISKAPEVKKTYKVYPASDKKNVTDVSKAKITLDKNAIKNLYYTGYAQEPGLDLSKAGAEYQALETAGRLRVVYGNNINAGKATVTISVLPEEATDTPAGDTETGDNAAPAVTTQYVGSKTLTFTIKKASLGKDSSKGAQAFVTLPDDKAYTGKAITATKIQVVTNAGKILKQNTDYTVTYKNNAKAGNASVIIKGVGNNLSGSYTEKFTIGALELTNYNADATNQGKDGTITYSPQGARLGKLVIEEKNPAQGETAKTITLTEDIDFTAKYTYADKKTKAAGSKITSVVIKGKNGCKGQITLNGELTIGKADFNKSVIVSNAVVDSSITVEAKVQKALEKAVVVTDTSGKKLKIKKDYVIEAASGSAITVDSDGSTPTAPALQQYVVKPSSAVAGNYNAKSDTTPDVPEAEVAIIYIKAANLAKDKSFAFKDSKATLSYDGRNPVEITQDIIDVYVSGLNIADPENPITNADRTYILGKNIEIVEGTYKNNAKKGTGSVTIRGIATSDGTGFYGTKVLKFKIVED